MFSICSRQEPRARYGSRPACRLLGALVPCGTHCRRGAGREESMANDVMTLSQQGMKIGHSSAKKPVMTPGRREFFSYRDLCIRDASGGQMRGQVMKAITGMTQPTGWHYHTCEGQFVYMLGGWVEL